MDCDFLLLKPNQHALQNIIDGLSIPQLLSHKTKLVLRSIFNHCLVTISMANTRNVNKIQHAFETLAAIVYSLAQKKWSNFNTDMIDLICGIDQADEFFQKLCSSLNLILENHLSDLLCVNAAGKLLLSLISASGNLHSCIFTDFLQTYAIFHSARKCFLQILSDSEQKETEGSQPPFEAAISKLIVFLSISMHYQKYDGHNQLTSWI